MSASSSSLPASALSFACIRAVSATTLACILIRASSSSCAASLRRCSSASFSSAIARSRAALCRESVSSGPAPEAVARIPSSVRSRGGPHKASSSSSSLPLLPLVGDQKRFCCKEVRVETSSLTIAASMATSISVGLPHSRAASDAIVRGEISSHTFTSTLLASTSAPLLAFCLRSRRRMYATGAKSTTRTSTIRPARPMRSGRREREDASSIC